MNKEEDKKTTDQQEAQMVKQAIKDDQGLSEVARDIHVSVQGGTVTLDGKVATDQQMNLAGNTAAALAVDDKVKNRIEVVHPK